MERLGAGRARCGGQLLVSGAMTTIQGSILGHGVVRKEDPALVAGARPYTADIPLEGALELAFVRSPLAHCTITSIDTAETPVAKFATVPLFGSIVRMNP